MKEESLIDDGLLHDEAHAADAFQKLNAAYPQHEDTIASCMWMGSETMADGSLLHHFKHSETRNRFTFRPASEGNIGGTVIGRIETGEDSADGDAVLSALGKI